MPFFSFARRPAQPLQVQIRTTRFWVRQGLALARGLALTLLALYLLQRSLIYHSPPMSADEFEQAVRHRMGDQAQVLHPFSAIVVEPPSGNSVVATVVYFHGNAGLGGDRLILSPSFVDRSLRLVLAEYPGYGPRPGSPSERALVEDAKALYTRVRQQFPHEPVMLIGESLGTGVASAVAADPGPAGPPARLVLLTPFRSLVQTVAQTLWMLPVRPLVKDHFDVEAALTRFHGPLALLVAGKDEVVGANQGRELADQARRRAVQPLAYVELPTAGHNSWQFALSERQWDELLGVGLPHKAAP